MGRRWHNYDYAINELIISKNRVHVEMCTYVHSKCTCLLIKCTCWCLWKPLKSPIYYVHHFHLLCFLILCVMILHFWNVMCIIMLHLYIPIPNHIYKIAFFFGENQHLFLVIDVMWFCIVLCIKIVWSCTPWFRTSYLGSFIYHPWVLLCHII